MAARTDRFVQREAGELIEAFEQEGFVPSEVAERADRLHAQGRVQEALEVLLAARQDAGPVRENGAVHSSH